VTHAQGYTRSRWLVLSIFALSTAINYLDRQTLATVAPLLQAEFRLSNEQYGLILSAFSVTYAASAVFAGMLIDRMGLDRAIGLAVGLWSCTGIATGFTRGLGGLVGCRAALGITEAAGIPAAGKAIHQYLKPSERALGNAVNQAGVSVGAALAPPVATWLAVRSGWRSAFVAAGALGLIWIPVWRWASGRAPVAPLPEPGAGAGAELLRDRRLWSFVAANALSMVGYSLWTNWTTKYLVSARHLTLVQAAWYAWIPPVAATLGGFAGGSLSWRWVARGVPAPAARFRACLAASALSLATAAIPAAPSAAWATAGISLSFFAVAAFSVNMYTLPLDVFGGARAAFAVSMLVASYGVAQAAISWAFGRIVDLHGYAPLTLVAALTPLAACALLRPSVGRTSRSAFFAFFAFFI
jgi:ACS family hexuronate transporter-like MFS transporter